MEKIFEEINNISEKLKEVKDKKYYDLFNSMQGVLSSLASKIEEVQIKQESMEENMEYIGDDLTDMREEFFEEVSFDELAEIEEEYVEIKCKHCGKPLFVEQKSIKNNTSIPCPFCNDRAN